MPSELASVRNKRDPKIEPAILKERRRAVSFPTAGPVLVESAAET